MSRRPRGDAGVSTVEFALVFPLFIGIVAIGAFFGWLAYTQAQVDRAAQRAARFAAVPLTSGTYDFCHSTILARVDEDLVSGTQSAAGLTVTDAVGPLTPSGTCTREPVGEIRISVAHTFSNPFSSVIAALTPTSGTFTVTGTGRARVER